MDKAVVIDSLGKHLDSLKATINWAILVACLLGLSGLMNLPRVKFLGLDLDVGSAFNAAAIFYCFVNLKVAILLFKLKFLMQTLTGLDFIEGLNLLAFHSFIGNPFGYFIRGTIGRINSAGPGLLIVAWWVANSSLYALHGSADACERASQPTLIGLLPLALLAVVGLRSFIAIREFHVCAMDRLKVVDPGLHEILVGREAELRRLTVGGILLGGGISSLVVWFRFLGVAGSIAIQL